MSALTVLGDVFLDIDLEGTASRLSPEAPVPVIDRRRVHTRPGGAGLAAVIAAHAGHDVTLVTALGDDEAAADLRSQLGAAGVRVVAIGAIASTETKTRMRAQGQTLLRLDERSDEPVQWRASLPDVLRSVLAATDAIVVADYGRGVAGHEPLRAEVAAVGPSIPVVWDPHPKGAPPVPECWAVTPNAHEAFELADRPAHPGLRELLAAATELRQRWQARALVVTRDCDGAVVDAGLGPPLVVPGRPVMGDACGAGDAFAVALASCFARRQVLSEAVTVAVQEATEFVARSGASALHREDRDHDANSTRRLVHHRNGARREVVQPATVVAAGGCFDLLHLGHVQMLERARQLGDHLVVLLNSDASVRALKGAPRPIVPEAERAAVLRALTAVDDVVVFDESTPEVALRRLRPDIFVKGGDYGRGVMPEQSVLDEWGGQAVVLPYLDGHSTSRRVEEMHADVRGR